MGGIFLAVIIPLPIPRDLERLTGLQKQAMDMIASLSVPFDEMVKDALDDDFRRYGMRVARISADGVERIDPLELFPTSP